jgi:hypothetical protein
MLWCFRRLFTVVEELVHRYFKSAGQLFQCLDGGNRMPILDTGDVAAKQTSALFDVALAEILFFTNFAESVAHDHSAGIIPLNGLEGKQARRCESKPEF